MVNITQREFNTDMEAYISRRTKDDKVITQEQVKEEKPQPLPDRSGFQKLVDMIVGQDEDFDGEVVQQTASKQQGLFSAIKGWFNVSKEDSELVLEGVAVDEPRMDDDIKEVLKILNTWLTKLPPKTIAEFKNSEDYQKYKLTLQKYKLIKS